MPILEIAILIGLLVVPLFTSDFHTIIATRMLLLAMLAISFDLCWGYSGIMTFGQALFFGVAGYVAALLANKAGLVQIWGIVPITMLVGLLSSFLIGWFLLLVVTTFGVLYLFTPKTFSEDAPFEPVPWALSIYFVLSVIRLAWAYTSRLPTWSLAFSVVFDMSLLMVLIWSFHWRPKPGRPRRFTASTT